MLDTTCINAELHRKKCLRATARDAIVHLRNRFISGRATAAAHARAPTATASSTAVFICPMSLLVHGRPVRRGPCLTGTGTAHIHQQATWEIPSSRTSSRTPLMMHTERATPYKKALLVHSYAQQSARTPARRTQSPQRSTRSSPHSATLGLKPAPRRQLPLGTRAVQLCSAAAEVCQTHLESQQDLPHRRLSQQHQSPQRGARPPPQGRQRPSQEPCPQAAALWGHLQGRH